MSGVFGLSDVRTEQIDRTWPEFTNYGYFVGGVAPPGFAESRIDRFEIATETVSQPPNYSQYSNAQAISDTVEASSPEYGYLAGGDTRGGSPAARSYIRRIDFSHELDGTLGITQISTTLPAVQDNMASISTPQYAYFGGGAAPYVCNIHRLEFSSETMSTDSSNLTQNRGFLAGVSGSQYGYFCGGFSTPPPVRHSTIDRMDFSTETGSVPPVGDQLTVGRSHLNSFESSEHGYIVGGLIPVVCTVDRLDFSSETVAATTGVPEIIAAGIDFSVKEYGYIGGNGPGAKSTIYRFEFSSETFSAPGAILSSVRGYGSGVRDSGRIKPNSLKGTDVDGVPISSTYGYFGGGIAPPNVCTIDRLDFSNETVSEPSSNLTQARSQLAAVSNSNYGYFAGGEAPPSVCTIDRLDFSNETVTAPSSNLTQARNNLGGVSNSNYGYFAGGFAPPYVCTIDRLDFSNETVSEPSSNLTKARQYPATVSNFNYGYFAGGFVPPSVCTIDRIDFSNETVSEPSSNLTQARYGIAAVSNSNYGYFAGGSSPAYVCTIDRLDFSNETVSEPSSELTQARSSLEGVSNSNYGYFCGGFSTPPPTRHSTIDRLDFSNETASAPSSNLTEARNVLAGVSN
jgi:hypothetical protein